MNRPSVFKKFRAVKRNTNSQLQQYVVIALRDPTVILLLALAKLVCLQTSPIFFIQPFQSPPTTAGQTPGREQPFKYVPCRNYPKKRSFALLFS